MNINDKDNSKDDKTIERLEKETIQKWNEYYNDIDNRIKSMWNFVLYNQFNNEEIKRLHRTIRFLEDDVKYFEEKIENLKCTNENLNYDLNSKENEIKNLKKKIEEKITVTIKKGQKRKREIDTWFDKEKKKPKKYIKLDKINYNDELKKIFSNIENIDDIIKLKDYEHRFDFLKHKKFKMIYKTIPSLQEFNSLVGMKEIKDEVFKMICYFVHNLNGSGELNHMVITGPPGVGKTTLAQLLGKVYLRMGFLENDNFIVAKRSDLIGKWCGHTAKLTQAKIDEAEGGVLFIDEVYSLGNPQKRDVFTKECIDTINQNLTEKGDKFLCIIAGYKEDVDKCFFSYNQGLARRFTLRFNIEKYDSKELYEILLKFINEEKWIIEDNSITEKDIENNIKLFKYYGGDMKTIFQFAKEYYSLRLMKEIIDIKDIKKILTKKDFDNAIKKFKNLRCKGKYELPEFVKNMYI